MTEVYITTTDDLRVYSIHATEQDARSWMGREATRLFVANRDANPVRKNSNKLLPKRAREITQ